MADLPNAVRTVAVAPGQRVKVDGIVGAYILGISVDSPIGSSLNSRDTYLLVIASNAPMRTHLGAHPIWVDRRRCS